MSFQVIVYACNESSKLPAISAIRSVTGLSVRESKHIVDRIQGGDGSWHKPVKLSLLESLTPQEVRDALRAGQVEFVEYGESTGNHYANTIEVLKAFNSEDSVGAVLDILEKLGDLA
jgi:hypothetical protein